MILDISALARTMISSLGTILGIIVGGVIVFYLIRRALGNWLYYIFDANYRTWTNSDSGLDYDDWRAARARASRRAAAVHDKLVDAAYLSSVRRTARVNVRSNSAEVAEGFGIDRTSFVAERHVAARKGFGPDKELRGYYRRRRYRRW